jgi:hypothetical protein
MELNRYIINKMGWVDYSTTRGTGLMVGEYTLFNDDPLVILFKIDEVSKKCYIIKENKLNSKNKYKFIVCDYNKAEVSLESYNFNSNIELFKLIIKHRAFNLTYKRYFNINEIINK